MSPTSFFVLSLGAPILPNYTLTFIYSFILSVSSHALTLLLRNLLCNNLVFKYSTFRHSPCSIFSSLPFRGCFSVCILFLSQQNSMWMTTPSSEENSSLLKHHYVLIFLLPPSPNSFLLASIPISQFFNSTSQPSDNFILGLLLPTRELWGQTPCIQIPDLTLTNCTNLANTFLYFRFIICKVGVIIGPAS